MLNWLILFWKVCSQEQDSSQKERMSVSGREANEEGKKSKEGVWRLLWGYPQLAVSRRHAKQLLKHKFAEARNMVNILDELENISVLVTRVCSLDSFSAFLCCCSGAWEAGLTVLHHSICLSFRIAVVLSNCQGLERGRRMGLDRSGHLAYSCPLLTLFCF